MNIGKRLVRWGREIIGFPPFQIVGGLILLAVVLVGSAVLFVHYFKAESSTVRQMTAPEGADCPLGANWSDIAGGEAFVISSPTEMHESASAPNRPENQVCIWWWGDYRHTDEVILVFTQPSDQRALFINTFGPLEINLSGVPQVECTVTVCEVPIFTEEKATLIRGSRLAELEIQLYTD